MASSKSPRPYIGEKLYTNGEQTLYVRLHGTKVRLLLDGRRTAWGDYLPYQIEPQVGNFRITHVQIFPRRDEVRIPVDRWNVFGTMDTNDQGKYGSSASIAANGDQGRYAYSDYWDQATFASPSEATSLYWTWASRAAADTASVALPEGGSGASDRPLPHEYEVRFDQMPYLNPTAGGAPTVSASLQKYFMDTNLLYSAITRYVAPHLQTDDADGGNDYWKVSDLIDPRAMLTDRVKKSDGGVALSRVRLWGQPNERDDFYSYMDFDFTFSRGHYRNPHLFVPGVDTRHQNEYGNHHVMAYDPAGGPGWYYVKFKDAVARTITSFTLWPPTHCEKVEYPCHVETSARLDGACVRLQRAGDDEPSGVAPGDATCDITLPTKGLDRSRTVITVNESVVGFKIVSAAASGWLQFAGITDFKGRAPVTQLAGATLRQDSSPVYTALNMDGAGWRGKVFDMDSSKPTREFEIFHPGPTDGVLQVHGLLMFAVKQCSCANGSGAVGADCPGHGVPHCVRCSPGYLLRAPDRGACDPIGRLSFDYRHVLENLRSDSVDGMDLLDTAGGVPHKEVEAPGKSSIVDFDRVRSKSMMTTLEERQLPYFNASISFKGREWSPSLLWEQNSPVNLWRKKSTARLYSPYLFGSFHAVTTNSDPDTKGSSPLLRTKYFENSPPGDSSADDRDRAQPWEYQILPERFDTPGVEVTGQFGERMVYSQSSTLYNNDAASGAGVPFQISVDWRLGSHHTISESEPWWKVEFPGVGEFLTRVRLFRSYGCQHWIGRLMPTDCSDVTTCANRLNGFNIVQNGVVTHHSIIVDGGTQEECAEDKFSPLGSTSFPLDSSQPTRELRIARPASASGDEYMQMQGLILFAVKRCTCPNGVAGRGTDCPNHGEASCVMCDPGHVLRLQKHVIARTTVRPGTAGGGWVGYPAARGVCVEAKAALGGESAGALMWHSRMTHERTTKNDFGGRFAKMFPAFSTEGGQYELNVGPLVPSTIRIRLEWQDQGWGDRLSNILLKLFASADLGNPVAWQWLPRTAPHKRRTQKFVLTAANDVIVRKAAPYFFYRFYPGLGPGVGHELYLWRFSVELDTAAIATRTSSTTSTSTTTSLPFEVYTVRAEGIGRATAYCDFGDEILGGGCEALADPDIDAWRQTIGGSYPYLYYAQRGWVCAGNGVLSYELHAFAKCGRRGFVGLITHVMTKKTNNKSPTVTCPAHAPRLVSGGCFAKDYGIELDHRYKCDFGGGGFCDRWHGSGSSYYHDPAMVAWQCGQGNNGGTLVLFAACTVDALAEQLLYTYYRAAGDWGTGFCPQTHPVALNGGCNAHRYLELGAWKGAWNWGACRPNYPWENGAHSTVISPGLTDSRPHPDGWMVGGLGGKKELQIMCLSSVQSEKLKTFRERRVLAAVADAGERRRRLRRLHEQGDHISLPTTTSSSKAEEEDGDIGVGGLISFLLLDDCCATNFFRKSCSDDFCFLTSIGVIPQFFEGFLSRQEAAFVANVPGLQPVEVLQEERGVDLLLDEQSQDSSNSSTASTASSTSLFSYKKSWMSFETAERGPHADDPSYGTKTKAKQAAGKGGDGSSGRGRGQRTHQAQQDPEHDSATDSAAEMSEADEVDGIARGGLAAAGGGREIFG